MLVDSPQCDVIELIPNETKRPNENFEKALFRIEFKFSMEYYENEKRNSFVGGIFVYLEICFIRMGFVGEEDRWKVLGREFNFFNINRNNRLKR